MREAVFLAGLVLLVAGVTLVYLPAGLMVAGTGLMVGAWLEQRAAASEPVAPVSPMSTVSSNGKVRA